MRYEWFTDRAAKKRVSELFKEFQLDEFAIEAEAIRRSASDLEMLDRMLASYEARRDKALRHLAECRGVFVHQLRETSDRIIDGKVLGLEHKGSAARSAAA